MNDTYIPLGKYREKSWYLVDAQDQTLGRLSTQIANLIQGKTQVSYTPGSDSKVYVVVVNADKIKVTGNKLKQKFYYTHTGKPGELKTRSLAELLSRFPYRVIELAVKRMLPNGFEKSDLAKRLRVYAGNEHPHKAQKPKDITFGK
jgi:large subunit ribosomal protein L13